MLLNPPGRSTGARTRNAVARAARVLGYDHVTITNLCAVPTASVVELKSLGHDAWELARGDLEAGVSSANAMLAGWGIAGVTGEARLSLCAQVAWLHERALAKGIESSWMVGGEPRHPSRWHQYVADKYQRTSGGSFEERIRQVLVAVPIRKALGAPPVGLGSLVAPALDERSLQLKRCLRLDLTRPPGSSAALDGRGVEKVSDDVGLSSLRQTS